MKHRHYVITDLETTGLDPLAGAEIVEIAAVAVNGTDLNDHHAGPFHVLIKPQRPELAHPDALAVIGPELWERAQKEGLERKVALRQYYKYVDSLNYTGRYYKPEFVAHNAPFDHGFLLHYMLEDKVIKTKDDLPYGRNLFDTITMFKCLFENDPAVNNFTLDSWLKRLGMRRDTKNHSAIEDTKLLAQVFVRQMRFFRNCHAQMKIAGVDTAKTKKVEKA